MGHEVWEVGDAYEAGTAPGYLASLPGERRTALDGRLPGGCGRAKRRGSTAEIGHHTAASGS